MDSRVGKDADKQTPSACAQLPEDAVSQEKPGFATEANEPSAQWLQRARPASDFSQPLMLIMSQGHPDPKHSQCDREASILSPSQQTPETAYPPSALKYFLWQ